ncbi:MAG: protein rep, partial [Butyrivibrio sp.]|nr:protein rep [Butyrivibrio sp.]
MRTMEQTELVKQLSNTSMERINGNAARNSTMEYYFLKMLANGIVKKRMPPAEIGSLRNRMKRLQGCNKFWLTDTYEESHTKVLLRTYLCKDRFCCNCSQMKKLILQNRFLPYLERYKDNLYHIVLTVPDCEGKRLKSTIQQMNTCFKTLVTYLNGNKKVKGIDLTQYGFQGCLRSLEVTYREDMYHPHFHVAAVLTNGGSLEQK